MLELGLVVLSNPRYSSRKQFDYELSSTFYTYEAECLPLKIRCIHLCPPPMRFFWVIHPIMQYVAGKRLRLRLQLHSGSDKDVLKSLCQFGFSKSLLPSEMGGNIVLNQRKWMYLRSAIECCRSGEQADQNQLLGHSLPREGDSLGPFHNVEDKDLSTASCYHAAMTSKSTALASNGDCTLIKRVSHGSSLPSDLSCGVISESATHKIEIERVTSQVLIREVTECVTAQDSSDPTNVKRGDDRMNSAVRAKLSNPGILAVDALLAGGFAFPRLQEKKWGIRIPDTDITDEEGISLTQRKNQLHRRLRNLRKSKEK